MAEYKSLQLMVSKTLEENIGPAASISADVELAPILNENVFQV